MKIDKRVLASYKQKYNQNNSCCNSTTLSKTLVFGGEEEQKPCCADLSANPPFWGVYNDKDNSGEITTDIYVVPEIECDARILISNTASNTDCSTTLEVNISGITYSLTINSSQYFNISANSEISFFSSSTCCNDIKISIYNETCQRNYPDVAIISLFGYYDCRVCPDNNIFGTSIIGDSQELLSVPFTNTLSECNIDFRFDVVVNTSGPLLVDTGLLFIYHGTDPVYSNNPRIPIFDISIPINSNTLNLQPGETMWLYGYAPTNGKQYAYEITVSWEYMCCDNLTGEVLTDFIQDLS